ncbi:AAA family ATPase [Nitratireductor sp. B36]|uniref:AAA family ATPase n=1 Tax=Nitratireductor sp. B36 TaxID=2762059 RepID=UPI001E5D6D99|nr:AAA family ATPase [Nitratireductor sp. B36]MCC5780545.1 AAA family ATPase [Nitratireductor sp. B36]
MTPDYSYLNPYEDGPREPVEKCKTKVINLFAGPGAGKSTTAAGLFNLMKIRGHNVELVTEFAKDLTWSGRHSELSNQLYILAKQEARLTRLDGKVDFIITDSPLLLGLLYATRRFQTEWFENAVRGAWDLYDNECFYIGRVKPYQPVGRNQTELEARDLDVRVRGLLGKMQITLEHINGDEDAPRKIYRSIIGEPA